MKKKKEITKNGYNFLMKRYGSIKNMPADILMLFKPSILKKLNGKELDFFLEKAVEYWWDKGFPYDVKTDKEIEDEYKRLLEFNSKSLFNQKSKEIKQVLHGLGVINAFHPHRWKVQCRKFRTPYSNFEDKKIFKKVIKKCIYFDGNPFDITTMRSILRVFSGTHLASNFRPSVVKFMIEYYCPNKDAKYLDPSMGYGGRLFGAITSNNLSEYHCCDPCLETVENNKRFIKKIEQINKKNGKLSTFMEGIPNNKLPKIVINPIPFETYKHEKNYFDLVFTSPPYFGIEKYSDEETQSWKKFPEYDKWLNGFLLQLFKTSYNVLKPGAYCAINIAGKVGKHDLEKDTIRLGNQVFGKLYDTIWLRLSKMVGTKYKGQGRNDRHDFKLEPIFIWKKI